jgi:predicted metal-dependent HD superfamily phosphohydrolase
MTGKTAGDARNELRRRWDALCGGLGTPELCGQVFDSLYASYAPPERHYHGIYHIADCLRQFDSVRDLASNPLAVELAIWFHDVVYDGRRNDNEERSADAADAALRRMRASDTLRRDVRELILLTRHNQSPATIDGQLIADIDLASLAVSPQQFDANGEAIRREYPHVADAEFDLARAKLLGRFLERPRIYYTKVFHDRYEQQARANLSRTIGALR